MAHQTLLMLLHRNCSAVSLFKSVAVLQLTCQTYQVTLICPAAMTSTCCAGCLNLTALMSCCKQSALVQVHQSAFNSQTGASGVWAGVQAQQSVVAHAACARCG